jgi:hypothetical protein
MKRRAVLLVAHPGHELLVHHWMERERPLVLVLTDGSGSAGEPRLEDTRRIVEAAGAVPGPVFGLAPDQDVYRAVLTGDVGFFDQVIERAAEVLDDRDVDTLVSDPAEACVLVHDLCAVIARLAVARATVPSGHRIRHFDFPIDRRTPDAAARPGRQIIDLDEAAVRRKFDAAISVTALADERERLLKLDPRLFEREVLTPVSPHGSLLPAPNGETEYERHGRERVAQGVFPEVITYAGHVAPLVAALAEAARSSLGREPGDAHAG